MSWFSGATDLKEVGKQPKNQLKEEHNAMQESSVHHMAFIKFNEWHQNGIVVEYVSKSVASSFETANARLQAEPDSRQLTACVVAVNKHPFCFKSFC